MLRNMKMFRPADGGASEPSSSKPLLSDTGNPMLNPVVLERLFKVCDLKDLFRFRLVSKAWYAVSLTRFRKEVELTIYTSTRRRVKGRILTWNMIDDLLELRGKPFESFRLVDICIAPKENLKYPLTFSTHNFWDSYGQWIHKLKLENCAIECVQTFKFILFEKLPSLEELSLHKVCMDYPEKQYGEVDLSNVEVKPNLKYLSVDLGYRPEYWLVGILGGFPINWNLFFAHFPSIRTLSLKNFYSDLDLTPVSKGLELLSKRTNKLELTKLWLNNIIWEERNTLCTATRRLFHIPHLKLDKFHVSGGYTYKVEEHNILPTALRLHGDTLTSLAVTNWNYLWCDLENPLTYFPFQTAALPSLSKLHVDPSLCQNLHFLELMPNLQVLEICGNGYSRILQGTNWKRMETVKLLNLQELYLPTDGSLDISEDVMETFVKMMPKVERFAGYLLTASFRVLCHNWRNMRSLRINSGRKSTGTVYPVGIIDDAGFTGIIPGSDKRLPNISDLKYLHTLELSTGRISDMSMRDGILELPHLCKLDIYLSRMRSIPVVRGYRDLRERIPDFAVHRAQTRRLPYNRPLQF